MIGDFQVNGIPAGSGKGKIKAIESCCTFQQFLGTRNESAALILVNDFSILYNECLDQVIHCDHVSFFLECKDLVFYRV